MGECACKPDFVYKSVSTFKSHLKSETHLMYEMSNEIKTLKEKVFILETDAQQKNLVEKNLLLRIVQLEGEIIWYRNYFSEQKKNETETD